MEKITLCLHSVRDLCRDVHDPKNMLESGVFCRRIDEICQTELSASVQPLKACSMEEAHFLWEKLYIPMYAIANDFHWLSSCSLQRIRKLQFYSRPLLNQW